MNFVTNLQATKQVVPAIGSLDDPAPRSESRIAFALLHFLAARFDMGDVAATRGRAAQLRVVVAFVAAKVLTRFLLGRWSPDDYRVKGGPEPRRAGVVPVRARKRDRQWEAVSVREIVPFGAQFSAICWVFSGLVPPLTGAETVAESRDWNCQSIPWRSS